ncbi:MBL fold metallo-hydrolase [Exiguobacterium sp. FSL W8-0210]|uniref:MBL fold metallo-hydrolase n=1 Tax=Exiguobacterium sp. FSL W8-0210 TaxID=2921598 RepID=UPI0030F9F31B
MEIVMITSGMASENGYLLFKDKECLVIDPGTEDMRFFDEIESRGATLKAILLTHAHFDHIGGVDMLRRFTEAPVYVHPEEAGWLGNPEWNGSAKFGMPPMRMKPADHLLQPGRLTIGSFSMHVLETPGHSPGSVTFYFKGERIAFGGDLLFQQGVGRTDLYGGDQDVLMRSLDRLIAELPADTTIYPGHGPSTTIRQEMKSNPFL